MKPVVLLTWYELGLVVFDQNNYYSSNLIFIIGMNHQCLQDN